MLPLHGPDAETLEASPRLLAGWGLLVPVHDVVRDTCGKLVKKGKVFHSGAWTPFEFVYLAFEMTK